MRKENILIDNIEILKGPHQLSFDITNKCNFRCLHCYNSSGENIVVDNELTDQEVINFIKEIAEMKLLNVCFCGGEPLIRRELIYECAKLLIEAKTSHVSLVTNGYLMTEDIAYQLKKNGIDRIQISIDGASPNTHDRLRNKNGAFNRAINAIKILKDTGISNVNVSFCPTAFNINEFDEVHNLLNKLDIQELRVQPLMLLGRANQHLNEIMPTQLQYRQLVKYIHDINLKGKKPIVEWGDPIDHLIRFRTIAMDCVNYVSIRANGDIVASPYLPLVVGNIRKHRFSEYWKAGLAKLWQKELPRKMAQNVLSIMDMNNVKEDVPTVWLENDIFVDFIDEMSKEREAYSLS
ncbi:radical SAM protein [Aceticella autotrophica]|uniref:Radical SAM protein n=1 Tax=Aceticella autotrophica TaxID=2755338 RepID=A0A975AU99_9THEO|nr:radical SAM protein [Aceticella autotrophica]QSZ26431.1 radical SAM protein [Aceticella autotrophica]